MKINNEVKDIFSHNCEDYHKMADVVDKYLVPTSNEKKVNAEISTPKSLRDDMINGLIKYGDPKFFETLNKSLNPV